MKKMAKQEWAQRMTSLGVLYLVKGVGHTLHVNVHVKPR